MSQLGSEGSLSRDASALPVGVGPASVTARNQPHYFLIGFTGSNLADKARSGRTPVCCELLGELKDVRPEATVKCSGVAVVMPQG